MNAKSLNKKRDIVLNRETFTDAAIFRRGFYSCPEEYHDDVSAYAEMMRKNSPKSEVASPKEILRKRRIRKKVRLIRHQLRKAAAPSRRTFPNPRR